MNIKEYAETKGLTKGAVYKAITRSGHNAGELTDRRGHITGKGLSILREIYPDEQEPDQEPLSEPLKETRPEDSALDELRERLSEAERARDRAEADLQNEKERRIRAEEQAEKWERLYLELQDSAAQERDRIREQVRAAQVLTAQAQEVSKNLSRNPLRRLFSGRKKDKDATAAEGDVE